MNTILFRKEDKQFYFLSNFSWQGFMLNGVNYKTNEHFYQSQKAVEQADELAIIAAPTPYQARKLGSAKEKGGLIAWSPEQQTLWNSTRVMVMMHGLVEKFGQNDTIRQQLIDTGDSLLVEFAPWDDYWGNGKTGNGLNMLGRCLMSVRQLFGGAPAPQKW